MDEEANPNGILFVDAELEGGLGFAVQLPSLETSFEADPLVRTDEKFLKNVSTNVLVLKVKGWPSCISSFLHLAMSSSKLHT